MPTNIDGLPPCLPILLTTFAKPYVEDWYLPTGDLRDSKHAANRAHIIVVTKCPRDLTEQAAAQIKAKLRPKKNQIVLFAGLAYGAHFINDGGQLSFGQAKKTKITLVTGIAAPGPLVQHLEACGLEFDHLAYDDHHFFSEKELDMLRKKELVLTTEKDYMRLSGHLTALYYLPVQHVFLFQGEKELKASLQRALPFL
jgi:tetraacyldisaccharide 4'-kinase